MYNINYIILFLLKHLIKDRNILLTLTLVSKVWRNIVKNHQDEQFWKELVLTRWPILELYNFDISKSKEIYQLDLNTTITTDEEGENDYSLNWCSSRKNLQQLVNNPFSLVSNNWKDYLFQLLKKDTILYNISNDIISDENDPFSLVSRKCEHWWPMIEPLSSRPDVSTVFYNLFLLKKLQMYQNFEPLNSVKYQQEFQCNPTLLFFFQTIEFHFVQLNHIIDKRKDMKYSYIKGTIRDIKGNPHRINLKFYTKLREGHSDGYIYSQENSLLIGTNAFYFSCYEEDTTQFKSVFLERVREELTCGQVDLLKIEEVKSLLKTLIPNYNFKGEFYHFPEFDFIPKRLDVEQMNHQDPIYYQMPCSTISQQVISDESQFPPLVMKSIIINVLLLSPSNTIGKTLVNISLVCKRWNLMMQNDEVWKLSSHQVWPSLKYSNSQNHSLLNSKLFEIPHYPNEQNIRPLWHRRYYISYLSDHLHITTWKQLFIHRYMKEQKPNNLLLSIKTHLQQHHDQNVIVDLINRYKEIIQFRRIETFNNQDLQFLVDSIVYRNHYYKITSNFLNIDEGLITQSKLYMVGTFMDRDFNQFEFRFFFREEGTYYRSAEGDTYYYIFQIGNKTLTIESYCEDDELYNFFEELSRMINLDIESIKLFLRYLFCIYNKNTKVSAIRPITYPKDSNLDIIKPFCK
ncbi:hypothetical protein DLAC_08331 [Tieghemostelium lacteum]|uniref:F-box domain-containing protein n=1 Tax=Tieghemostelium lacteum TaxID=361077 RepID=A0A151ZBQ4_TIELA|nr:hypothetical protein DLAC_08331 [Tieghemostelium lacteum]|eukprot:KYQ91376.1 hypothetical protein DLAC_08331 [Tieghemostelium lacteum]